MKFLRKKEKPVEDEEIIMKVSGMTCDHCATSIEKTLITQKGILNAQFSYKDHSGRVTYSSLELNPQGVVSLINDNTKFSAYLPELSNSESVSESENIDKTSPSDRDFDLIIVGGGSAAFSGAISASEYGKRTLIINGGLPIGGTCVNIGCVPSKYIIKAADSFHLAHSPKFNSTQSEKVKLNFDTLSKEMNSLVTEMRDEKYEKVAENIPNLTIVEGWAKFEDSRTVQVGEKTYAADNFLIATGSRTNIPNIEGIDDIQFYTTQTLFELQEQPTSMTVLGAGYIGLELASAYAKMGTKVTVMEFTERVLKSQTPDISSEIRTHLEEQGVVFMPNHRIRFFQKDEAGNTIMKGTDSVTRQDFVIQEDGIVLIATGTIPNSDKLGLENIGVNLDDSGRIVVDGHMSTNLGHIYGAGDCCASPAYVYTAAKEAKIAIENLYSSESPEILYDSLPWVVFTDPQIAGAGMDEDECERLGIPFEVSVARLDQVPHSIVAHDTRGFIKLIRNPVTDELLGGRVVAPHGGELAMQLSLAIEHRISVQSLADSFHPYLTLSEGIKIAAIGFHKNVAELSCCAT